MVISGVNTVTYNGDGITYSWPFTFPVSADTEIKLRLIYADGTSTAITSDYYVDMVNSTAFYPGYAPGSEPPEEEQPEKVQPGQKIEVYREIPMTQEADLGEKWPFQVIEKGLDKLTMICQQIYSGTKRELDSALANITRVAEIAIDSGELQTIVETLRNIDEDTAKAEASAAEAKDWANKTSGTVDGSEWSAKYYATQAAASATTASTKEGIASAAAVTAGTAATNAQTIQAAIQNSYGYPFVAATSSAMTDTSKIYVYTGSQTGYTSGNWYYHNGSAWVSGGVYNSTAFTTDTGLSVSGMAADSKKTGDFISVSGRALFDYAKVNILSGDWEIGGLNSTTGVEITATNLLRTGYIAVSDKSSFTFTGVKKKSTETDPRVIFLYCYNVNRTYLGRSSQIISGTAYIRVTYGFTVASGITVAGYGKANLIADFGADFTNKIDTLEKWMLNKRMITVSAGDWEAGTLGSVTGEETSSTVAIRTRFYPVSDKATYLFTGKLLGAGETIYRIHWAYSYDAYKTFLGRSNSGLYPGAAFVRFVYAFATSSGITIAGYGMANMIADYDVIITAPVWQDIRHNSYGMGVTSVDNVVARKLGEARSVCRKRKPVLRNTLPKDASNEYSTDDVLTGTLYSSVWRDGQDIYRNMTLETYYSALGNPASVMYTKDYRTVAGTGITNAWAWYGGVCSTFVSTVLGFGRFYTTHRLATLLSDQEITDLRLIDVGDFLIRIVGDDGHIQVISQVYTDSDGNIVSIDISEQVPPKNITTNVCFDEFQYAIANKGYKVYHNTFGEPADLGDGTYAEDIIYEYGNHISRNVSEMTDAWFYIPSGDTVYYRKDNGAWSSIGLSGVSTQTVNGVTVYDLNGVFSGVGVYDLTTDTNNSKYCTIKIVNTGTISVTDGIVTLSGYEGCVPKYCYMVRINSGETHYAWNPPAGYHCTYSNDSVDVVGNTADITSLLRPTDDGYKVWIDYDTDGFGYKQGVSADVMY